MSFAPTRRKRWFAWLVKLLVVAIVVWGVRRTLLAAWENLEAHGMWPQRPAWLVAAGVFYLASIFPAAIFWYRILLALGHVGRRMGRLFEDSLIAVGGLIVSHGWRITPFCRELLI